MTTYYETLSLAPTASAPEIESACEQRYLRSKGLVTHHDPAIALEASQELHQIELIRTTLTDPAKRSAYDQALGLGGTTSALVDLSLARTAQDSAGFIARPLTPPPSRPAATTSTQPQSLWTCATAACRADNPPNTKFCFKCGTQLVRQCPNCDQMASLLTTQRCGECGYSYEAAGERRVLRERILQLRDSISATVRQIESAVEEQNRHLFKSRYRVAAETLNAQLDSMNVEVSQLESTYHMMQPQ